MTLLAVVTLVGFEKVATFLVMLSVLIVLHELGHFILARRNGVALPFASVDALRAAYSFTRLQDFLDLYYQGADALRTGEDFHDLALAYGRRAAADGVVHAEIFFRDGVQLPPLRLPGHSANPTLSM